MIEERLFTTGVITWQVLQRKPGALRNGAPFADFPAGFKRLHAILLKHVLQNSEFKARYADLVPSLR
jgi:hypothetical protein